MKRIILVFALTFFLLHGFGQESMVTFSGGYSFAKLNNYINPATGWRISGLYEFNPYKGMLVHGAAIGYSNISASKTDALGKLSSTVTTVPVYYAPKLLFGGDKAKAFIKGTLGIQFATLERTGFVTAKDSDSGFYGGGGAGGMLFLTDDLFLNAEYEIAWVKNNFYGDGWLNSAMIGVGMKF